MRSIVQLWFCMDIWENLEKEEYDLEWHLGSVSMLILFFLGVDCYFFFVVGNCHKNRTNIECFKKNLKLFSERLLCALIEYILNKHVLQNFRNVIIFLSFFIIYFFGSCHFSNETSMLYLDLAYDLQNPKHLIKIAGTFCLTSIM